MTYRRTLTNRPWLDGATYDKYTGAHTVHYDLYAFHDVAGFYYFEIMASVSGKQPLAWSMYRYEPTFGILAPVQWEARPAGLTPVQWSRRSRDVFNRVHARLIGQCVTPAGYASRSILAHYVTRSDADPWPRGTVNMWREPAYGEGKKPGRPPNALKALL